MVFFTGKREANDALSTRFRYQFPPLDDNYLPLIDSTSTSGLVIPAPIKISSEESLLEKLQSVSSEEEENADVLSDEEETADKIGQQSASKESEMSKEIAHLRQQLELHKERETEKQIHYHPRFDYALHQQHPLALFENKDDWRSKYGHRARRNSRHFPPLDDNYLPLIGSTLTSGLIFPAPIKKSSEEFLAAKVQSDSSKEMESDDVLSDKEESVGKLRQRFVSKEKFLAPKLQNVSSKKVESAEVLSNEEESANKLLQRFPSKEESANKLLQRFPSKEESANKLLQRFASKETAKLQSVSSEDVESTDALSDEKESVDKLRQQFASKESEMSKEIAHLRRQLELSKEREAEKQINYSRFDYALHQQHPLALFENKDDWRSKYGHRCYGCEDLLTGPTYECTECQFLLHKSCAEDGPQREIESFFHPCTLFLVIKDHSYTCNACFDVGKGFAYRCEGCDFDMHVECARRPVVGDEEELVQHFSHWHPLEHVHTSKDVGCAICDKLCSVSDSSTYCCKEGCDFVVHDTCMKSMPRQVKHPIHPTCTLILITTMNSTCSACDGSGSRLIFRCGKCNFQLDVKCALTKDMIQHFSHKHPLVLRESEGFGSEVRCKACGENCLLDPGYGCINRSCHFFIHKKCADELRPEIHHPFHFLHPLTLLGGLSYKCKVCEEDGSDLVYRCEECKFQLDLKCAFFPTIESKDADKVLHSSHKHPLALYKRNELGDNEVRCRACTKSCVAHCFGCTECDFYLHETCAVELQEKEILHPFHPHPITLMSPASLAQGDKFQCSSCLGLDDWCSLRYRCAKCDFDMHIDCAKPKLTAPDFKYEGHLHDLTYFDKTLAPVRCNICHDDAQTCFFRCVSCAFNVHIYCIPSTPKTIKHHRHLHPLTVTKSPFGYELIRPRHGDGSDDNDDDFYCDVCEKKRYKFESVYYCAECKYIAEVSCVISELLPSLYSSDKQSTIVSIDEGDSAKKVTIATLKNNISGFRKMKKGLKKEIEEHKKSLKKLEDELKPINFRLKELQIHRFLYEYHRRHSIEERYNPTEAHARLS